jgi:hypothetical protein
MTLLRLLEKCPAGKQPKSDQSHCELCPRGTYQPEAGEAKCISCSPGKSTKKEGALKESDCEGQCCNVMSNVCLSLLLTPRPIVTVSVVIPSFRLNLTVINCACTHQNVHVMFTSHRYSHVIRGHVIIFKIMFSSDLLCSAYGILWLI